MKKRSLFLLLVLFTILITSCKYNFIVPEEVTPPTEPVSYAAQVQPIFTAKCIECHKSGGQLPNLTEGNSFSQIVPAHVNLTTAEESDIYKYPSPSSSIHTWKKYSSNEANLVLTWIKEGAKNN